MADNKKPEKSDRKPDETFRVSSVVSSPTDHLSVYGLPTSSVFPTGTTSITLPTGTVVMGGATTGPRLTSFDYEKAVADYQQVLQRSGKLEVELRQLKEEYAKVLAEKKTDTNKLVELESEIKKKEKFGHLLNSVGPQARMLMLTDDSFARQFDEQKARSGYVTSIDIRRSTELMLKATKPELFAEFITTLCVRLRDIVWDCHGLFDKFTGDGILAFFPEFYSGPDAGYLAILAAARCHEAFQEEYARHRYCFHSVMNDVGLGIGIDFGETQLVSVLGNLTVVGTPVVYACRLGGAPPGMTFLNQQAYDKIFNGYSAYCNVEETEIEIKHEGKMLAYAVKLNPKKNDQIVLANWLQPKSGTAKSDTDKKSQS